MMRFKAVNGILFIILGAAIFIRMLMGAGLRFEAVPGLVLGAAMCALGIHRTMLLLRTRT